MFNGVEAGSTGLVASSLLLPASVVHFSSKASVLSFLIFCLLYTPCIASVSMLLSEIGKKWTLVSIVVQFISAYVISLLSYNLFFAMEIFGFWKVSLIALGIFVLIASPIFVAKKIKRKQYGNCQKCGKKCKRG